MGGIVVLGFLIPIGLALLRVFGGGRRRVPPPSAWPAPSGTLTPLPPPASAVSDDPFPPAPPAPEGPAAPAWTAVVDGGRSAANDALGRPES